MEYLWLYFQELEAGRPIADGYMLPIPPTQYQAWCWLKGVRLRPWEMDTLRMLDLASVKAASEKVSE